MATESEAKPMTEAEIADLRREMTGPIRSTVREDYSRLLATIAALTRERDEAVAERDALRAAYEHGQSAEWFNAGDGYAKRMRDERDHYRARLATAERVVEAAREMLGLKQSTTIVRIGERPAALRAALSAHDAQATPRTESASASTPTTEEKKR